MESAPVILPPHYSLGWKYNKNVKAYMQRAMQDFPPDAFFVAFCDLHSSTGIHVCATGKFKGHAHDNGVFLGIFKQQGIVGTLVQDEVREPANSTTPRKLRSRSQTVMKQKHRLWTRFDPPVASLFLTEMGGNIYQSATGICLELFNNQELLQAFLGNSSDVHQFVPVPPDMIGRSVDQRRRQQHRERNLSSGSSKELLCNRAHQGLQKAFQSQSPKRNQIPQPLWWPRQVPYREENGKAYPLKKLSRQQLYELVSSIP